MIPAADQAQVPVLGDFFATNREYLEYYEDRPLLVYTKAQLVLRFLARLLTKYDCSWMVTQVCDLLGWADPSGPGVPSYVDGDGNTTTIFGYLPHVAEWLNGDMPDFSVACVGYCLGFLELNPGDAHITMIAALDVPGDPLLISWGYQQSPVLVRYSVERLAHPGQTVVVLDTTKLVPASHFTPPKPKEEVVGVAATTDSKGLVHVFQELASGEVYSIRQKTPDGDWEPPFLLLDNGKATPVDKAVDAPSPALVDEPLTPGAVAPVEDAPNPGEPSDEVHPGTAEESAPIEAPVDPTLVASSEVQPASTPDPTTPETATSGFSSETSVPDPSIGDALEPTVEQSVVPAEPAAPAAAVESATITIALDGAGNGSQVIQGAFETIGSIRSTSVSPGNVTKETGPEAGTTLIRVTGGQPGGVENVVLEQTV